MKYVYPVIMFLLAFLCGCASEEYAKTSDVAVSFTAKITSGTETRAAVDTSKNTVGGSEGCLSVSAAEQATGTGITGSASGKTRTSTVDGIWSAGNIAVEEGTTVKEYSVDASGNITSSSPFYWTSESNVSVTSWYPYSASLSAWTVNNDQSTEAKYGASDLLYGSGTLTYGSSNTLSYTHKTAKVVVNIVKANDVTSVSSISWVTIGTSGTPIDLSGTVGSTGAITASTTTTGYITPYQTTSSTYAATYSALLIPQDMNGKQFIAIKVSGGNIFYYMPSTSTPLSGGYIYTYNVTVPSVTTNIGDYYFSDGSWGTLAVHATSAVWPIGVIFSNSPSTTDQAYGWKHGYAIALTNASTSCTWGTYGTDESVLTDYQVAYTSFITNKDGYTETQAIKGVYTLSSSSYPAFYYALNYGTSVESGTTSYAATSGSSGWYLPSVGQWWDIETKLGGMSTTSFGSSGGSVTGSCYWYDSSLSGTSTYSYICASNINVYLTAISTYATNKGYSYGTPDSFSNSGEYYWASSEYDSDNSYYAGFYSNGPINIGFGNKKSSFRLRPVVCF
jgi:hypothetical protein